MWSSLVALRQRAAQAATAIALLAAAWLPAQAAIPASERQALIDLYNSTHGDGWTTNTGWKTGGSFSAPGTECFWFGVFCADDNNTVTQIDLDGNHLTGTLSSLTPLTALTYFVASDNGLTGTIPALPATVETLWLQSNLLSGPLPALPAALEWLQVYDNRLTGSLPALPGGLKILWIANNQLTGPLPALPASLEALVADNNQLSGPIPALPADLQQLDVSGNQLSGVIPALPAALRSIRVDQNQLSGVPPAAPASLAAGVSALCPNFLRTPSPTDAAWNAAVSTPWSADCTAGYLVSASAGPGGTTSPPQGVAAGATATLTFTPDAGQTVDAVNSSCGGTLAGNRFTTGPVNADCTVSVSFRALPTAVPTLGQWSLMLLGLLAAGLGGSRLRRRA